VRVNLIGLCQGGCMAALVAARFPHQVYGLASPARPFIPMPASLIFEIFFKFQEQVKGFPN
jgi:hypothetical protein